MKLLQKTEVNSVVNVDDFMTEMERKFYKSSINESYKMINVGLLNNDVNIHLVHRSQAGRDTIGFFIVSTFELRNAEHNLVVVKHYTNDDFSISYHRETNMYSQFDENIRRELRSEILGF